ncbi:hypothetical protein [Fictibacillus gelatini]|uniref:hypothetical protein n=1 Tax=Fictibacillus gelatini TaxID=225985 RepID=UPI000415FAE6|nr:hypothetical protein [Fictibacillus gelatini]
MSRNRFFENDNINPKHLDTSLWPNVLLDQIDDEFKPVFLKRKQAVELYLKNDKMLKEISALTGISPYWYQPLLVLVENIFVNIQNDVCKRTNMEKYGDLEH